MRNALIALDDSEVASAQPAQVFNQRLQNELDGDAGCVALQLRPEIRPGIEMLDWLEKWVAAYRQADKEFVVVPATTEQLEVLEVSHPDQNLRYVRSVEDLGKRFLEPPVEPPVVEEPVEPLMHDSEPALESDLEQVVTDESVQPSETPLEPEGMEPETPAPVIGSGSVSEIAGEYSCVSCGAKRMWFKGETISECENPECLDTNAGWQLCCDLF